MNRGLADLIADKRLLVFVGEGGVGKTSSAAAVALGAAAAGRRVAVLTVDPAPRLGDALGLDEISHTPAAVALPEGCSREGSLVALRLDTKHTFDRVVENLAPTPQAAQTLFASRIYQGISSSLGGSEHYMAFQRLYELVEEERYDLLVVDTPPAARATDLLSTPVRLGALLDTGAPAILADPARILARGGSRFAKATALAAIALIERVSGVGLAGQIKEFAENFAAVIEGLGDRTQRINELLRSPTTAFCLVTRPDLARVDSALEFTRVLIEHGIEIDAMIINRITAAAQDSAAADFATAPEGTAAAIAAMEAAIAELRGRESAAIVALESAMHGLSPETRSVHTASLFTDVGGLHDLTLLAADLCG